MKLFKFSVRKKHWKDNLNRSREKAIKQVQWNCLLPVCLKLKETLINWEIYRRRLHASYTNVCYCKRYLQIFHFLVFQSPVVVGLLLTTRSFSLFATKKEFQHLRVRWLIQEEQFSGCRHMAQHLVAALNSTFLIRRTVTRIPSHSLATVIPLQVGYKTSSQS